MSAVREYLHAKELALALGVTTKTIYRAKSNGFKMAGGVATLSEYRNWHARWKKRNVPKCPILSDASKVSIRTL